MCICLDFPFLRLYLRRYMRRLLTNVDINFDTVCNVVMIGIRAVYIESVLHVNICMYVGLSTDGWIMDGWMDGRTDRNTRG